MPDPMDLWVTTANGFEGYRITRYLGVVRGITVRSRSVVGTFAAGIQTLFGGNISIYTELAEQARSEAYQLMQRHAREMGANGVVAMRYDATEMAQGVTEVLAYGTAVVIERATDAAATGAGAGPRPA
ncbi:MAG: YbjQ family protein [Planctomycetes bacterium]|nr:YbjQ family protein [Planctomycetota bacterium]